MDEIYKRCFVIETGGVCSSSKMAFSDTLDSGDGDIWASGNSLWRFILPRTLALPDTLLTWDFK
jgi:hypothetical protein